MTAYFGKNEPQAGHSRKSLRGGVISIGARGINGIIQVLSVVFLARLLTPEDYGLVGMVWAIVGITPMLIDLGTHDALLQQPDIKGAEVSTLFWITFGLGLLMSAGIAAIAPLIAHFYHDQRLTPIAGVCALTILITSLPCQHQALMRRSMMFKQLGVIDVTANLIGATTAVLMAFYGYGYWSLVVRLLVHNSVAAAASWLVCGWIPGKPAGGKNVKDMLKFGVHLLGFSSADFVGRFGDRVAIGYTSGASSLGFYQKAMLVYENLLDLFSPLHSVAMASLSKLREEREELKRSWGMAVLTLSYFAMPVFGLLAVIGKDLLVVVLGGKWATAGMLAGILALRGIPHVVERTVGWLHVAAGRADRCMRWGMFSSSIQIVALLCGLPFGPRGVAISYVIFTFALFLPAIAYSGKPWGIGAADILRVVGKPMTGSLICVVIGKAAQHLLSPEISPPFKIAVLTLTYLLCYFGIVTCILQVRSPLRIAGGLLREWGECFHKKSIHHGITQPE